MLYEIITLDVNKGRIIVKDITTDEVLIKLQPELNLSIDDYNLLISEYFKNKKINHIVFSTGEKGSNLEIYIKPIEGNKDLEFLEKNTVEYNLEKKLKELRVWK